jgi:iron complex transport system ATP-binding protein
VYFNHNDISSMNVIEIARNMGFVFQEHSAPFPFSVLEVVRMGRAPYLGIFASPSGKDTLIAEQALEMVGLLHLKNKPYTQISGGERQLVLIARSIAQGPQMIIFDEPTSHLDFKNQTLVLRMVKKLSRNGITVIMTTHLPNQALLHSSRVALMNKGNFIAVGKADQVMTEENLSQTYDINIKIVSALQNGKKIKVCISEHDLEGIGLDT